MILREPLVHFLLIGATLFLVFDGASGPSVVPRVQATGPSAPIVVTQDDIDQLSQQFEKTWQHAPGEKEQQALIDDFVRNEVLYREALALGLDRGDVEIRRRLRQRMEFLYEDVSQWAEPSEADLTGFMNAHRDRYVTDPQVAFRQVFVNTATRGAGAEPEARRLLAQLEAGADPDTIGDATMLEGDVPLAPRAALASQFGDAFVAGVLEAPLRTWVGPIRSSFGLHLIRVSERTGGQAPSLEEVREAVRRDWTIARQNQLKDAAYEKIRGRYDVRIERRAP